MAIKVKKDAGIEPALGGSHTQKRRWQKMLLPCMDVFKGILQWFSLTRVNSPLLI
jgi:hypothetical protein